MKLARAHVDSFDLYCVVEGVEYGSKEKKAILSFYDMVLEFNWWKW